MKCMLADTRAPCKRFSAQVTSTAALFVDPQLFPFQLHSRGEPIGLRGKRERHGERERERVRERERGGGGGGGEGGGGERNGDRDGET